MQPFYLVVRTYLRLLVVAGISHFGAKCALALLSESDAANGVRDYCGGIRVSRKASCGRQRAEDKASSGNAFY